MTMQLFGPSGANTVNRMLAQAPLPEMVQSLAKAIAEAQLEMDRFMVQQVQLLADAENHGVQLTGDDRKRSMLELGFTPNFYHFSEVTIRARVAFSSMQAEDFTIGASITAGYPVYFAASINASYTNKYSFNAEGSSEISTRIVAVPPPSALTALIDRITTKDQG